VRAFLSQINLNSTIKNDLLNLTVPYDSLKRKLNNSPDTLFNVDQMFADLDGWKKQDIMTNVVNEVRGNNQMINNNVRVLYEWKSMINRHEMERHKKFTLSLAVLIFFFIGAPLGAIIRKGGLGMPVVVSILLFIIYYIFSMTGEKSAREDIWDMVVGMWFSSFIFLSIGVWLTYKAVTDSTIMRAETYTDFLKKIRIFHFIKRNKISDEDSANNQ
jgi:lipopolysaccharide export system permease protein